MESCRNTLRKYPVRLLIREESEKIGVIELVLLLGTVAGKSKDRTGYGNSLTGAPDCTLIQNPFWLCRGEYVTERVIGAFRVTNHKLLPAMVRDWKPQPLTPEQIDPISRQLDERRDVED